MSSLHKISVSSILIFLCINAAAEDPYRPLAGATEAGTGYACITKNSFWSSFHNQALLANFNDPAFGFNYQDRYGIDELATKSAGVIMPAGKASIGVVYSYFGYRDYRREMAALACGLELSDKISAGVQADYFLQRTSVESFDNSQAVICEAGMLINLGKTSIGFHVFNPLPHSWYKSEFPSILRIGVGNKLTESLFAAAEAEMSTGHIPLFRTGFEYEAFAKVLLRGGFSTDNNSFSFGLGYHLRFMQMDLAFSTHDRLGVTSSASMVFIL
ncbi:MAG TPA: hypothetical protein VHO68_10630 [Bacteroidales bacterium]|nr:hypothetical protein [Bacteroidales bacterium]